MSVEVGQKNPYRYRGYRYDNETGFYLTATRHYDPEIGRFINTDTTDILDGGNDHILENNLYTYCFNNPTNYHDPEGTVALALAGASHLQHGDVLKLESGNTVTVWKIQIEHLKESVKVYNFEVEDFHTYYVGENSVLVHNICGPLKGNDAVNAAKNLGYKATKYYSNGQKAFYNAKKGLYITADIDAHNGGVWKMAKTVKDLGSKTTRMRTYDEFLKWIGK
ncbi:MAG: toxin C-terminal domain-containing protein [Ethanoligenens sp.]